MAISIDKGDSRYQVLEQGHNLRWPTSAAETVDSIELCNNAEDVVSVLQHTIDAGRRPTIRSGGHCYEDFTVNNPAGTLIDVSLLPSSDIPPQSGAKYQVSAGARLGDMYLDMFKRFNVTLPGGSCTTVGAGGHISGGGYGVLSRLHGLTVDWLSAVEIVTVDEKGKASLRRADKTTMPDLFRACCGAGGGNFGIITGYFFDELPIPPKEVVSGGISFNWSDMTETRFVDIVMKFGDYWGTRGKDEDTWGLFSGLDLSHSSSGRLGVGLQFCNNDGTCRDLRVVNEFLDLFAECKPLAEHIPSADGRMDPRTSPRRQPCASPHRLDRLPWLDATIQGGGGRRARAKYKSTYMKENFTAAEAKCIYKHLKRPVPGVKMGRPILAVDSYGGAVNRPALAAQTSVPQRASTMKLQFQAYWKDAQEDAGYLAWMRDFYTDLYSGENVPSRYAGTPYPGKHYEGCYINYPDKDMLAYPFWPQLYYGDGDLYPFLQNVKQRYDPHNLFHHAMSIRPKQS
jgi:FAD/FMN-containing dehydrogenase